MKTVITYGTFDVFHIGHVNLLRNAKALGDFLVVAVSTDEFSLKEKNKQTIYSFEERFRIVESIRYVDLVIPENSWEQKVLDVKKYNVDVFTIGDDWKGKFDFLKDIGCEVVYLPRTPNVSSSEIKEVIKQVV